MGVGGQRHAPAALLPVKIRYPLYWRLGGPQGRSGRVRKLSTPPGFDPRTVQPVASRYTDWTIPAHIEISYWAVFMMGTSKRLTGAVWVPEPALTFRPGFVRGSIHSLGS